MRAMRTAGVKQLVEEALATLSRPVSEDVIDDVFCAIAEHQDWRRRYDELCNELGKTVVNTWGGFWVAQAVGRVGDHQVPAKSGLTDTYSKLFPAPSQRPAHEEVAEQRVAGLHTGAIVPADDFDAPLSDDFWVGQE